MKNKFNIPLYGLVILLLSSCNRQPEAAFTVSDDNPHEGVSIDFTNTGKKGKTYQWNFGDTEFSTEENPSHTFARYGTYNVILTAYSSKEKKRDTYTVEIIVRSDTKDAFLGIWNLDSIVQNTYNLSDGALTESFTSTDQNGLTGEYIFGEWGL